LREAVYRRARQGAATMPRRGASPSEGTGLGEGRGGLDLTHAGSSSRADRQRRRSADRTRSRTMRADRAQDARPQAQPLKPSAAHGFDRTKCTPAET
jgi:hypothetical protein